MKKPLLLILTILCISSINNSFAQTQNTTGTDFWLTFMDNIHLETLGDEKTALFIIIPSSDTTFNFLAAMMYTQLFDTLYDRAINFYHGRLPVHVRFICDEFANGVTRSVLKRCGA